MLTSTTIREIALDAPRATREFESEELMNRVHVHPSVSMKVIDKVFNPPSRG